MPARQPKVFDVDVQPVDAVEDAFGVVDEATHGRGVAVGRRQRSHALLQGPDHLGQRFKFGRHRISLGVRHYRGRPNAG